MTDDEATRTTSLIATIFGRACAEVYTSTNSALFGSGHSSVERHEASIAAVHAFGRMVQGFDAKQITVFLAEAAGLLDEDRDPA